MAIDRWFFLLGMVACTGSAKESTAATNSEDSTSNTATTDTQTSTDTDETTVPDFHADVVPIFARSCGSGDNNCHSAIAYFANVGSDCKGWLSLEDRDLGAQFVNAEGETTTTGCPDRSLYQRLTELGSWECSVGGSPASGGVGFERKYVAPGDLTNSYLDQKILVGGEFCYNGTAGLSGQMPLDVNLDPTERATLEAWIEAGALE